MRSIFTGSFLLIGCSAADPPGVGPMAGAANAGAPSTAGGASGSLPGGSPSVGGYPSVMGGAGVAGSNVSGSAGAPPAMAGAAGIMQASGSGGASAGAGGTTAGQGGTTSAGMAGMSVTGGGGSVSMSGASSVGGASGGMSGGGKAPVDPSAGCGKMNPQTGSAGSPLTVSNHQYYVKLPTNYDASKPYPVIFMFNPTNNPIDWAEKNAGFESNDAKGSAIRVYPHPQNPAGGWGAGDVSFFQPLYDQVTNNFCADKARMFAAGESSGGDFSSILGCEHANKLRAIGPCATKNVPQYPLDASGRNCTGQVTSVVIHGIRDSVVGTANGPLTRDFYREVNNCGTVTMPVTGYTNANSNCVQYQGCDAGYPVYWCSHSDPNYGDTNHGWPAFAAGMLWGVFSSY